MGEHTQDTIHHFRTEWEMESVDFQEIAGQKYTFDKWTPIEFQIWWRISILLQNLSKKTWELIEDD